MNNLTLLLPLAILINSVDAKTTSIKVVNKYAKESYKTASLTFEYENDTILQKLKVIYISKLEIKFALLSVNKKRKTKSQIEGIAKCENTSNAGTNEDENGLSYLVTTYYFESKECWLSIDLGGESEDDKVQISESNCEKKYNKDSPFASIGILRKVKNGEKR